jgi:GrpB-like predicted nucleotidyltransferase (UPF0157 family)
VDLFEYDASWPKRFEAARAELEVALGEVVLDVHHIGSTAVPGLVAKSTIDIALVVSSIEGFIENVAAIEALGYEYRPEAKFHEQHLFLRRIEGDECSHHLHVVSQGCPDLDDWLDLRDWLRASPVAAMRYGDVKRRMAQVHCRDRGSYVESKTAIIETLLAESRTAESDSPP